MRELVHEWGGRLEVESDAGGTLIRAVIPIAGSTEKRTWGRKLTFVQI